MIFEPRVRLIMYTNALKMIVLILLHSVFYRAVVVTVIALKNTRTHTAAIIVAAVTRPK